MYYTVYEAAFILNVNPMKIYYDLLLYNIQGFFKVLSCWRLSDYALEELYGRYNQGGYDTLFATDLGRAGFESRLKIVREKYAENPARSPFEGVQSGRGMECEPRRSDSMVGGMPRIIRELDLFEDGDYW